MPSAPTPRNGCHETLLLDHGDRAEPRPGAPGARPGRGSDDILIRRPGPRSLLAAAVVLVAIAGLVQLARDRSPSPGGATDPLDDLRALPYTAWSDEPADPSLSGVVHHDPARASAGYNLYASSVKRQVYLMGMEGRIVHVWAWPRRDRDEIPRGHTDLPPLEHPWRGTTLHGRRLAMVQKHRFFLGLDPASRLLWKVRLAGHHAVTPAAGGGYYVPVREVRRHRGLRVRFDSIVRVLPDGTIAWRWSTFHRLEELRSALDTSRFLDERLAAGEVDRRSTYNFFHLNSVERLGDNPYRDDPRFRPENLLVCLRNVDQIAILDPRSGEVAWSWGAGELDWPHQPTMGPAGTILVLDNGAHRGWSRVVDVDPISREIVWQYPPPGDRGAFFTRTKGGCQRLPNGNVLICSADEGRAFEVDRSGRVVWDFRNPVFDRRGRRAVIYRMSRYSEEEVAPLLREAPRPVGASR